MDGSNTDLSHPFFKIAETPHYSIRAMKEPVFALTSKIAIIEFDEIIFFVSQRNLPSVFWGFDPSWQNRPQVSAPRPKQDPGPEIYQNVRNFGKLGIFDVGGPS